VVALVALAGCSLPFGGTDAGPADDGGPYPPGVSADGVDDATALLEAHAESLADTGFRARSVTTTRVEGGSPIGESTLTYEAAAEADASPFRLVDNNSGGLSRDYERVTWGNETVAVQRRTDYPAFGNATTTYRTVPVERAGGDLAIRPLFLLTEFLVNGSFEVAPEGDRVVLNLTGYDGEEITDATGEVVVDREGRIRSAEVEFAQASGRVDGRLASTTTFELRQVGDVDVERPDWVSRARRGG
jgi:hypothetical protein